MDITDFADPFAAETYLDIGPLRAVLQRAHHFVKADQEDASTASWHFADQYVEKIHFLQDLNSWSQGKEYSRRRAHR